MKKLLMIGAILIMGTMGYAGQHTDLDAAGNGSTTLTLKTTGNVVSAANKVLLVITPKLSAGASGDALEFNFGTLIPGGSTTLTGKFEAQVITGDKNRTYGTLVDSGEGKNITVGFVTDGNPASQVKSTATGRAVNQDNKPIATLTYALTGASGVKDSGKTYEGEVSSTLEANKNATGTFFDRSVGIAVQISNLTITAQE